MRARRGIALVLLTVFLSGFSLPWLAPDHRFNDDIDGEFIQTGSSSDVATLGDADLGTADHCLACHWLRSIRAASGLAASTAFQTFLILTPPLAFDPSLQTVAVQVVGARGPPAAL
jgi:hypothetical protein